MGKLEFLLAMLSLSSLGCSINIKKDYNNLLYSRDHNSDYKIDDHPEILPILILEFHKKISVNNLY